MERRDFLKYFGVGASVIPFIGGESKPEVQAKLIEEPKVDIIEAKTIPSTDGLNEMQRMQRAVTGYGKQRMRVTFTSEQGDVIKIEAYTFITEYEYQPIYWSEHQGAIPNMVGSLGPRVLWNLKGVLVNEPSVQSLVNR